jgi:hypothetical protein
MRGDVDKRRELTSFFNRDSVTRLQIIEMTDKYKALKAKQ